MVRLTATLIVRNEAEQIAACLGDLKPIVDEIIVVDTGSTDQTPVIAASLGAKVHSLPWRDDFSYARNAALDHASGQWILYIDADERVAVDGELNTILDDPNAIAARVSFRASSRLTHYREHRLFRNRTDIRFCGVIHETIMPDINALVARGEGTIVDAPLSFEHLGYEGDLSHKHRRNLPLLQRAVAADPQRIYLWHALGEAHSGLGDHSQAEAAWCRGLAVLRQRQPLAGDVRIYAELIGLRMSETEECDAELIALVEEASQRHPDDPMILWWRARLLIMTGHFNTARNCLNRLLEYGPNGPSTNEMSYDRQLFGAFAWGLLGVSWLQQGEPKRALEWLRRAEHADRSNLEIRVKRAFAESLLTSAG